MLLIQKYCALFHIYFSKNSVSFTFSGTLMVCWNLDLNFRIDDCGLSPNVCSLSSFLLNDPPTKENDDPASDGVSCSAFTDVATTDCGGDELGNGKSVMLDADTAPWGERK